MTPVVPWVLGGTLLGLLIIVCVPAVSVTFSFQTPTIQQGLLALGTGAGMLFLFEITKKALNISRSRRVIQ
jgi:hypothetical protein